MSEYVSPLVSVIVTLLVVFTIFGLLASHWWKVFKRWFAGFKDIHLVRSELTQEVKLEATVRDQDYKPLVKIEDVRKE